MKRLVLLLLLGNIGFFAWFWFNPPAQPSVARPLPAVENEHRLVLLDEVAGDDAPRRRPPAPESAADNRSAPDSPDQATPSVTTAEPPRCYRISGVQDAQRLQELTDSLIRSGGRKLEQGTERVENTRYWVMLPAFSSKAAAQPVIARLKRQGVTDYYLIPDGENANALSLGVFSQRDGAERHFRRIKRLGYDPEIKAIALPHTRHWALYQFPASASPEFAALLPPGVAVPKPRACP